MSKRRPSLADRFSGAPTPTPAGEQAYLEELYQIREQEELEEESKGSLVKRATRRLTRHRSDFGSVSEDELAEKGPSRRFSVRKMSLGKKSHHKEPDLLDEQVCRELALEALKCFLVFDMHLYI